MRWTYNVLQTVHRFISGSLNTLCHTKNMTFFRINARISTETL
ncbi:hypothetical protein [Alysiella filiformis]|nr:hypothetical protein [Alysiella filiformis]